MILVFCIVLGLFLRAASGRPLSRLTGLRLRGEGPLLLLLCVQAALPLVELTGVVARIAFWVWLGTFPLLVGVAWANRRQPGMPVLGAGLALNAVVIALNQGMPVSEQAVLSVGSASVAHNIPAGDFVHVLVSATTRAVWLADVIPVPGPTWMRSIASVGDCLLFVGVVVFLAIASGDDPENLSKNP